jgi:uncharacterized repeat protein (TIGR01451 family)
LRTRSQVYRTAICNLGGMLKRGMHRREGVSERMCSDSAALRLFRRHLGSWFAWLIVAWAAATGSAAASTCYPATSQGTAPNDYQDYCWLDFTAYNDTLAQGAGQPFSYTLPDGSTLSFTLKVTTNKANPAIVATASPSWSGAAIGHTGFIGIAGLPVLYEGTSGSTVTATLTNITVTAPPGSGATVTYDLVGADGESTNSGETLSFTTNGASWVQLAQIANGTLYPTVAGVGTATVTETGVAGTVGAYAFGSLNNPTQVSTTMVGNGLEGAMFAIRYASLALNVQYATARAFTTDQFTYSIKNSSGTALATGTTTGASLGPFTAAVVDTDAAGFPFVVNEVMAAGSTGTLANYVESLTCTNLTTGSSSTTLPTNQAVTTYSFPALHYGDAVSCLFTNTANRADVVITKSGPATVAAGATLSYSLLVANSGPAAANGFLVQDPVVANFTQTAVTCAAATGGAACPAAANTTVALLTGAGIAIPTLPNGGSVTFTVSGTAGTANITNVGSVTPPAGLVNSNTTPTSSVTTTVTASADLLSAVSFPATVNAGQPVSGTVTYTNNGPSTAAGTAFTLTLSANLPAAPTLTGLPAGATYSYNTSTGVVTFTGMPTTLASAASVGPITVSYTQPPAGTSTVTATDSATTADPNSANNTATATIGGVAEADLASAVSFPASVNAGQPVSGTVTYTNNGPSGASGVAFSLMLSANLPAAPTLTGLPAGATYSYNTSTGVVTFTGMPTTLASAASVGPITVSYTQPPAGTSSVTAAISATTADPNSSNNTATATITGAAEADLASAVSFPASVNAGQAVSGTLTYTNNGPSSASGVTFGLTLAPNLAAPPVLTGLPAGATYAYTASTGVVTLTGMPTTLASAATVGPITVSYTQPASGTSTVTATISATTADPNAANNTAAATITGVAEADLASAVSFPASVNAGQTVSGTLTYTNNGPSSASGVSFGLTLSSGLSAAPTLSGLPAGATYSYNTSTGVVTLTGMPTTLASGASVGPITVSYTQPPSATSTVTATISATTADPNPANNTATASIGGVAVADLASAVSFPVSVNAGQAVSGTLTYTNNGPSSASGASFGLTLSSGLSAPTLTGLPAGATYSYNATTGVVSLTGMPTTLASGASVGPITVGYTQPGSASSTVTATDSSATLDPNPANNTVSATIGGSAEADLASAVSFPASVNAGQTVSGTVTYTNNGPSSASGVSFGLTLSSGLAAPTLTGLPAGATYSYNSTTGVVTFTGMPTTLASASSIGPITVSYTQAATGTSTVTATVSATTADPNAANNTATTTISGSAEADLASAVSFPASVNAGQPVSGTLLYSNNGPSSASGVSFGLTLSSGLSAPTLTGLPAGATYSYNSTTGVVTFTGMPTMLASGSNVGPITVSYTQPASGTSTVTAAISATTADPNPANNTATASIGGVAVADLASAVSFPVSVNAGQAVSGTVTYTNNGPSSASGASFGLTLSSGLSAPTLTGLPAGATYSYNSTTGVVTFTGIPTTLASGSNVGPITVSYTQPASGTSTVTATDSSSTLDSNPANNTATATIAGVAEADLASAVSFPASVNAGQPVSGTVTYTNNGPSAASGVAFGLTLSANLPAAPTLTGLPAGATFSYNSTTGVVTFTGMPTTLAAAASVGPITVSYTQPPSGISSVTATVSATTADPNSANNTATATITGVAEADLASTVTFPASVNAGQPVSGTVKYTNNGPSSASGTTFSMTLSPGLSPTLSALPAGATYSYNSTSGVVTFAGMPSTLASGSSVGPITVSYTQLASGTSTATASDNASTADPNPANNTATATITGVAEADLASALSFPASVNAGQAASGTVTYTNNGPSTASGVAFGLTLSSGLSTPTLTGLPAGATYSYNSTTGVVTLTGMPATLATGATVGPITVSYTQPASATSTVTATISATTADPNSANNTTTATIAGVAEADLASALSFPASVNAGQAISGTVTYTNNGPSAASGVAFGLTLSAGLSTPTLTGLPAGATYSYNSSTGVVTFTGMPATLATGATVGPITVSYTQPPTGTSTVTATISATTADPNSANNTATATITGVAEADLASALSFPASVNAGQAISGTVTYTNNGPSSASGVSFGLTLSAGLSPTPTLSGMPAGATYSYNSSTGVVTLTGMPTTLASGASIGPITVSYTQTASGTSTVTATISATTADPNSANNTATATISGVAEANVATAVSFPASVNAGQPVSGMVTYTNNGPSSASGVTFGLTLSAGLSTPTLTGLPAGATYSYNSSTGVVTLSGMPATLAAGATVGPITVSYTQPATGTSTVTSTINSTTADPNPANNTATATITGVAEADLASALSFPASVNAGQAVSGTVTYTNNGPSSASGVAFGLTLSANLPAAPTLTGLPAGATFSYNSTTGVVTLTGMPTTLASGASVGPITVSYTQPPTATSSVTATISATTADPNSANNTATATITGVAEANVATAVSFPASVNAGQSVSGTVTYTDNGPSSASGVTYGLTLTSGLSAPTLTGLPAGATYSYNSSTGVVTLSGMPATLASGASVGPITVSYIQPATGTSTVTSTINSTTADPNPANNTATATITGVAVADLASSVTFPATVNAGQPVSGTVTYTNNGPSSASAVTFGLMLSAGLSPAPTLSGLPVGATYSYNSTTGVITFTGMPTTLASGTSVGPITVSYTQPPAATSSVTASVNSSTLDPNPANNTATTTISGSAEADLASAVSFPASVNAGQSVSGTVTYTNSGPSSASGVAFGLTLSANLSAAPTLSGLPVGATYSYNSTTGVVTFTGMPTTLAAAASVGPITVSYTQPPAGTSTVTATVSATTADPNPANNTATATVGGVAVADLASSVSFPASVNAGQPVSGTVTYTNNGPSSANGVTFGLTLSANLPAAPTLTGLPVGATYSYNTSTGVVTLTGMPTTLASGATVGPISVSYTQPPTGTSTVTATISASTLDPNPANNTATATIGGAAVADLASTVTFPATVNAGQTVSGTVTYTNNGPSSASGVAFGLTLSANLSAAPTLTGLPAGATYSYNTSTGVVTLSGMPTTLASAATVGPITVSYTQPAAATSTVSATISASTLDPNPANNTATATIGGVAVADLASAVTFPATVNAGQTVSGTVLYTNNGPSSASGVSFGLTLSANLPAAPTLTGLPAGATYSYNSTTGVVTLAAMPTTLASGSSIGPITVSYTQPPSGTSTVTATISASTLDPNAANNTATATIGGVAVADLASAVTFPASVNAGQPVSGTVTYTNNGPSSASGVTFGLTLSANLSTAPTLSGLPAGATYSYNTSTGVVTFTGMPTTLASAAAVGPITVSYTQPPAGTSTVTATINASTFDSNPANNTATATIGGVAVADLASSVTFPASVNAGQPVSGTVTYTNNGPSSASGVTFGLTLSANLSAAPTLTGLPAGATFSYNSSTGVVTLAGMPTTLASAASIGPITVSYTQPTSGTSTVTATIGASTLDPNPANNTATATIAGSAVADLASTVTFPATVNAGQTVSGTVLYRNNGPSSASAVSFGLTLSSGLSAAPTLTGLPAGATYSYNSTTGVVTFTGMPTTLASAASVGPITVSYTQPASGTSTVTASVNSTTLDPNPANNSATATIGGVAVADVASRVTFPTGINAGQPVSGTVQYTNNGPSSASAVSFGLTLSPNLSPTPTLTGLPAGATYSYNSTTGVVTFTGMPTTLASGASVGPITVSYTQPSSGSSSVTATVSSTTLDPNPANNTATTLITGSSVADLASTVTFPASVNAGQPVSGTVLYTNNGPSAASAVTFGLTLSSGLSPAPTLTGLPAGATYSYNSSTGVVTLTGMPATLASGASVGPITVSYTQPASASSTVTASVNSTTLDPNPANNTATATIGGSAVADLASTVTFPATVNAGQAVSGTVLYTNNGPSSASGVSFALTLSSALSAAPTLTGLPAGATYSYNSSTGVVTLTGMPTTLASGATVGPITVSYTQPASGSSSVTATISATTLDPNSANNTATATIGGSAEADLASAVTFPASVNAGQPVSGTVKYTNNGPSSASGTTFSLTLSANLSPTLSGLPAGATYSYSSSTGVVTFAGMPTTVASGNSVGPITVSYTQPASGSSTVTAADSATTSDPNPANNTATATIAGSAVADLASAVAFPASVNAGQPVSGTVTYTNNGPSSATVVSFGLTLSANLSPAPTLSGLPAGATYSYTAATGVVTLTGMPATLASGASIGPITVGYTQPAAATSTVTATINSTTVDPNPANNTATATVAGSAVADLAGAVSFPASVNAGQPVSGTVTYTNNGPSSASAVTFGLTLSGNLSPTPILSGLPAGATYSYNSSSGVVTLTGMPATLASAASIGPITVSYTQAPTGTSTVTATISATTLDPNPANNTSTATIAGSAVADLASAVTFPASVNAGQAVSGKVLYTNNGPSSASGVTFGLTLSANLSPTPTLSGLPAGATYSYAASTGVVTLTGMPATLASGASIGPITVSYTQPASGSSTVTATDGATTTDPNPANNTATASIGGVAVADLASAVTFPASVNAGQPVSGTVTYTNNGPSTASAVTFGLMLSANLPAAPTLSGLPAGATYSYAASTGVVTLTGMPATLASGASIGPITVSYTQPPAGTSTVTATVSATTSDPNPANNTATATIGGSAVADLASSVTFPASVNAGQPVSGTVLYTNNGPSSASGVAFGLTLSANLPAAPVLSGLPAGATYSYTSSTGVVTLTGMPATLASASSIGPITVSYTQAVTGTSTVTATVSATTLDPNPANNTATASIGGIAVADLATALSFPASVNAGQPVSGTVTYTNNGPSSANGATFALTLSANLSPTPTLNGLPAGATYSYAASTGVVTLTGMPTTLTSGAGIGPITVGYTQPASGTSTVTATDSATTSDPNPANNTATAAVGGVPAADLASTVSFPATINAGQPVSGTVQFTNSGPSSASGVTFALTLSANLPAAPVLTGLPAGATYSYTSSTGVVTLTGMPATLASGISIGPITVSYTQPPAGTSTVTATIGATTLDPNPANNSATATIAGVAVADLASRVTFPASVNAGQPVSGTVQYTNNGPSSASGVSFGLTLSANLAAAPTLSGLPAGATYSYAASTGVVTLTGMPTTVASAAVVGPITVSYTQPPAGTSTVTATVSATTSDPNPANNTATATIGGVAVADLATALSFPASVNAGQPVSGTVTYTNNGPSTASTTTFALTLSPNLPVAPVLSGLPAGVTYSYAASTGVVTLTGMPTTLASGAGIGPITVNYTQPASGTSTVTATDGAATSDPNPANNTASATIAGVPAADLASTVSFPASVNAGQPVSGTVRYTNNGPSSASAVGFGLTLSASLPAAPTLTGLPAGATYSYNTTTGVVNLTGMPTTLASGIALGPITVSYTQPPAGSSTVTATINATTLDPNPANNTATATIAGVAVADLASAVSFPASVNAGQPVSGTVRYTNSGPSSASGVSFGLTLSANLAAAPTLSGLPAGASYSYSASTGVVTLTGMPATMASGSTLGPITVSYTQAAAGTSSVTATVSATTLDPNPANNSATATIAGAAVADLASAVSFPATVNAGQPVSGTVTYTNNGPSTASAMAFGLTLSANLPAAPVLSGLPGGATYSYAASTGVVTLTGMPATLTAAATIGPVTVNYTQPASGSSTVTATVSATTLDPIPANNTATATIGGVTAADLASTVSFPASVNAGQPVSGTVQFTNNGPSTASAVTFGLTLSPNLTAAPTVTGLPAGATYSYIASTGVVTLSGMPTSLAAGVTIGPITVSYTQPPAGTSTVTAAVHATTLDPNPANNTATATIAGVAVADLASAVSFPASVNAGQTVSGTVRYTNNGPSSASGVSFGLTLTANLPATPSVSGLPAGATYSYSASTGVVTLTSMPTTMASAAVVGPIAVSYTQPPAGTSTVTATVSATTSDPNAANNAATASIAGAAVADLASAITFPASVNAGQAVSGSVTYSNNGPSTASVVTFGLTLSPNLPAAPTLSGLPAGATYSYAAGTGVVTLAGMPATLASGASVGPISVSYTQPPAGTSTVTATIHATTLDPTPANNTATATITGVTVADLASAVAFPASVNAGQPVSGSVTYSNNGPSTASVVTFGLTLSPNLPAAPTLSGLPAGATYSYAAGTGVVTLAGMPATLASGASVGPISVSYTQPPAGTSTITATIHATTLDPTPANNTATASITGVAVADLASRLTFPATVNAGLAVSGTVLFANDGPSSATAVSYALTLSPNLPAAPTLSALPAGATDSYNASTGVVTLSGMPATLASGSNVGPITVSYTQPASGSSTVTATIASATLDPDPSNNTAIASIAGVAVADLASKVSFPASADAGQAVSGTVLYTNNGPSTASAVTFDLTLSPDLSAAPVLTGLPAGVTYGYTPSSGVVTLSGLPATLASGSSIGPITVSYTQPASGTSAVTATITSTTLDPNPANNLAKATITVVGVADLSSAVSFPASANAGQPVSGTVRYTNNGPSGASAVVYGLTLPANLTAAPTFGGMPAGAGHSYNASTGVVTFTAMPATLASGGSVGPITVSYAQLPSGTSSVTATVSSATLDPNPANNTATATIAGAAMADLSAKATFPANANAGQPVSGAILYTNNGPSTAAGVAFGLTLTPNLPAAPVLSGLPTGAAYSYSASTGVVSFTGIAATLASGSSFGPITVSYTQPASASSTITASVNSATPDPNPANNTVTVIVEGAAEADLASKVSFPTNAEVGQPVSGSVVYTNNGPSAATGVSFALTLSANLATPPTLNGLPTGATYSYAASTGGVTITGLPATLASGSSIGPISVSYTQPSTGSSSVTAGVNSSTLDPNTANNTAKATIATISVANVSTTVSFPAHENAGQSVSGTVVYSNSGPSTATGVTYSLTLSPNLGTPPTLTGLPTGATYSYNETTGVVTFGGMPTSLALGGKIGPISVSYTQPPSGTSVVTAAVNSTTLDPDPAGRTATATITGAGSSLTGTVFIDNNQDRVLDSGDTPVADVTVELFSGSRLVASVVTGTAGTYEFPKQPSGTYTVTVTPGHGYVSDTPTPVAIALGGAPQVVNFGWIPAGAAGSLVLTKTTPLVNVSAGQSVPYTITATNPQNAPIIDVNVVDTIPAGFVFRKGSGYVNGKKLDPTVSGRELTWTQLNFAPGQKIILSLVLTVGAGVTEGEFVNQATAFKALTRALISNVATATVRIVGDPTFDCPDIIGKVFDDANGNGYEDPGEKGIAGVRLVTAQGLLVTTDKDGRYHIACPVRPDSTIGTDFIVKVDERTLPSGYRLTTDNPETVRLTAGKVTKLNFGASIHRVVRVEVNAAAFDILDVRPEVAAKLDPLVASLKEQRSIVRIAYSADSAAEESDSTVQARLDSLKALLAQLWKTHECRYPLLTEEDIVRSAKPRDPAAGSTP